MADRLVLDAKLDLAAAAKLQGKLEKALNAPVSIDAGQVSHMGALCTQILLAAARKAKTRGHAFNIINTSDRVLEKLSAMGLSPEIIAEGNQ